MDDAQKRLGAMIVSVVGALHISGFYNLATLHPTLPLITAAALVYLAYMLKENAV